MNENLQPQQNQQQWQQIYRLNESDEIGMKRQVETDNLGVIATLMHDQVIDSGQLFGQTEQNIYPENKPKHMA